jgi:hypothetical protein
MKAATVPSMVGRLEDAQAALQIDPAHALANRAMAATRAAIHAA